jgi:hypothetical protein
VEIERVLALENTRVIIFWSDGSSSSVPLDLPSPKLEAYEQWLAEGNTPEPWEAHNAD